MGDTATLTTFPAMNINGQSARVMAFGSNSIHQGFSMRHGAKANGGGHFVNQYTLLMDVMFPAASSGQWRALFQTDPFNHDGNDAEFYVGNSTSAPDPNGLGADGQFNGSLAPDTWYRIAFAVDLAAPAGEQLSKYVNGVKVADQSLSGGVDGRYALGPTALLFTTGISGGGFTQPGFVSSIQFVNGWMPPEAIAALGGPGAGKLPPGNAAIRVTNITFNSSLVNLGWTGPDGLFQVQTAPNLSHPDWQTISNPSSNRSLSVPVSGATDFYRVMQLQPDIQVGQLPNSEQSLPSKQILRAPGQQLQFGGRPVDLALSPDGRTVFIKNMSNLLVVDAVSWSLLQTLAYPASGASMHGIAVSRDGSHVYVTGAGNELYDWAVGTNGAVAFSRTISLPGGSDPCGVAISADGSHGLRVPFDAQHAWPWLTFPPAPSAARSTSASPPGTWCSRRTATRPMSPTGAAVCRRAATSRPLPRAQPVVIDSRGVAASGAVSFVDLTTGRRDGPGADRPASLRPGAVPGWQLALCGQCQFRYGDRH